MRSRAFVLALVPLLSVAAATPALAQLRRPGVPASARAELPADVPLRVYAASGTAALRAAAEAQVDGPLRYGVELPVKAGVEDAGRWDTVPGTGELVWRLELASPGAYSLGVVFSEFDVPEDAQVFLYSPDRSELLGAYGAHDENPNGVLAIQPLRGDRVVIEYVERPGTRERPRLVVGQLIHDYRDVLAALDPGGIIAVSCLVDVNCPQVAAHQDIKRAVVWLFGGGGGCSGSILNNTAEDGTPYLMTAEHCGDMTNAVAVFDYERSGCGSGSSSTSKTISGATLLERSIPFDSQLYLLNHTPPANYEPFYAGWSLAGDPHNTPFVGISHPGGQPKKYQRDNQSALLSSSQVNIVNDVGIVQPGSSGSPLFDADERVVGTLTSAAGTCGNNFANYGRFDRFYETQELAQWLDPMGWGLTAIDGYDPFEPYAVAYNGDATNPELYSTAEAPLLGTTWTGVVDASGHPGATASIVVGYTAPAEGPTVSIGQLLVDTSATKLLNHGAPVSLGLSQHDLALPGDLSLAGLVVYTQAFVVGGGTEATNGLKLVLNF